MDKELLRKVQLTQLEMLLEVDKICKKNNIKYFLIGGTLLGAIRHKGFIPWDDDLDIGMFREDYERFKKVCKKSLSSQYFLQNYESEQNYWMFITKVRKNGTLFEDNISVNTQSHEGIYIDIFPLDNIPQKDSLLQRIQYQFIRFCSAIVLYKNNYRDFNSRNIKNIAMIFSFLSFDIINKIVDKIVNLYNKTETNYVTSWHSNYGYSKQKMSKDGIYGNGCLVEFEGEFFPAPMNYDAYLKQLFGDYMKLPPEEERGNRHVRYKVRV